MDIDSLLNGSVYQNISPKSLIPFLDLVKSTVITHFPEGDPRLVANTLSSQRLLARMRILREEIKTNENIFSLFLPVWTELGFDLDEIYLDAIRIRCVPDKFHENLNAQSIAFIHRDPWYANPQCQLNFWIPIFDVEKGSGFKIYPNYFSKPVKNNSNLFNYAEWISLGGFQSTQVLENQKQLFPEPTESINKVGSIDIYGNEASLVCFASHHLHGTSPNLSGKARFTLEIRFVLRSHLESRFGPSKMDNYSQGSTLEHMYDLFSKKHVPKALIQYYEDGFVLP